MQETNRIKLGDATDAPALEPELAALGMFQNIACVIAARAAFDALLLPLVEIALQHLLESNDAAALGGGADRSSQGEGE